MKVDFEFEKITAPLKLAIDSSKVILAVGISLVFLYCFTEGFAISGLTISDIFLFSYVAFSFTLLYVIGFFLGGCALVWSVNLLAWLLNGRKKDGNAVVHPWLKGWWNTICSLALFVVFVLFGLVNTFTHATTSNADYWSWIGYFLLVGFFACLMLGINSRVVKNDPPLIKKWLFVLLISISFLLLVRPHLLNLTMSQMGIRSKTSDVILLDSESYQKTISVAKLHHILTRACQIPEQSTWIVENLSVVWYGFGDKGYLEISQVNPVTGKRDNIRQFSVPKTGVEMIRGGSQYLKCQWFEIK